MYIIRESNKVIINEKEVCFKYAIDTILEFSDCYIILLMDDTVPDNNIEAFDYNGNRIWNISQIVKFAYPESYVSLSKETEASFSVVTYNGVKFVIDAFTFQIVNKDITK